MAPSHADSHDLDKLVRWHQGLSSGTSAPFPAYAVFLVGPDDRYAHDGFRQFRSSFEQRGVEFQHLVIFGQHGVSRTVLELLAGLGLTEESLPLLALCTSPSATDVWTLSLAQESPTSCDRAGLGGADTAEPWRIVLNQLEDIVDGAKPSLNLASITGLARREIQDGPMERLVNRVLKLVS